MKCSTVIASVGFAWAVACQLVANGAPIVQDRATDMLALVGGERLFGLLTGPPHGGNVGIVVDRQWFRKHQPDMYRKTTAGDDGRHRQVLEQLRDRLTTWRQRREEPKLLASFIERSLAQTERKLRELDDKKAPPEPSQLVLVEVPQVQVRKQYLQPEATRRVLALAWQERMPGAEEQSAATLIEQLKAKGIDAARVSPDLSDRLGALAQDERQWAAKVALVEYEILGKPHYVGTGSKLFRDDSGQARPDLAEIAGALLEDQLGDLFGEVLNPTGGAQKQKGDDKLQRALADATRAAAAEGMNGLRVSYLSWDLPNNKVTVHGRFLARMPDGDWKPIWEHTATPDTNKPRTEQEEQLSKDLHVAEALDALAVGSKVAKELGLEGAEEQVRDLKQRLLRFAVMTEEALHDVNRAFVEFMLSNVRRLDGPPIAVADGTGVD